MPVLVAAKTATTGEATTTTSSEIYHAPLTSLPTPHAAEASDGCRARIAVLRLVGPSLVLSSSVAKGCTIRAASAASEVIRGHIAITAEVCSRARPASKSRASTHHVVRGGASKLLIEVAKVTGSMSELTLVTKSTLTKMLEMTAEHRLVPVVEAGVASGAVTAVVGLLHHVAHENHLIRWHCYISRRVKSVRRVGASVLQVQC